MPGHGVPIDVTTATAVTQGQPAADPCEVLGVTGRLQAVGRAQGFEVRYPNVKGRAPQVCRVDFDPADPSAVILNFGAPLQQPMQLFYGAGRTPIAISWMTRISRSLLLDRCSRLAGRGGQQVTRTPPMAKLPRSLHPAWGLDGAADGQAAVRRCRERPHVGRR